MNRDEIVKRRNDLNARRAEASAELTRIQLEFSLLSTYCSHENLYSYTAMGEPGTKCPDCAYAT